MRQQRPRVCCVFELNFGALDRQYKEVMKARVRL